MPVRSAPGERVEGRTGRERTGLTVADAAAACQRSPMKLNRTQIAGLIMYGVMLALGVGLGAAVATLPADRGDVLSFAGSLIGAALTIFGAIYLIEHQRRQSREASRDVMKRLIQEVLDEIASIRDPKPIGDVEDALPALLALGHVDRLEDRIRAVKLARSWFTPDTAGMVRAFAEIESLDINSEAIHSDLTPNAIYGGVPDLERHLGVLEARANIVRTQLHL